MSVRELAEHVWHVNDEELVTIPYVIHLTNELAREEFQSGCIWQEFVDELELIVHSPLDHFEIIPLIPMKHSLEVCPVGKARTLRWSTWDQQNSKTIEATGFTPGEQDPEQRPQQFGRYLEKRF
ncbi:hypothetical protein H5410_015140 [Solanum commersonii]|uniref:Uncharacterized protein n=1 Tax=Solanum commersonii TaxID=4109 RepID=A0A9J5ZTI7_SOLCO|nr:hypothetical protein H5410_015140 [Solanum commersonii]